MQFLYISTLKKIKSILPKKKITRSTTFSELFFSFLGIYFPFWNFFLFFLYSSERQIEFWRIIKDYVQYFPSLF